MGARQRQAFSIVREGRRVSIRRDERSGSLSPLAQAADRRERVPRREISRSLCHDSALPPCGKTSGSLNEIYAEYGAAPSCRAQPPKGEAWTSASGRNAFGHRRRGARGRISLVAEASIFSGAPLRHEAEFLVDISCTATIHLLKSAPLQASAGSLRRQARYVRLSIGNGGCRGNRSLKADLRKDPLPSGHLPPSGASS